MVKFELINKAIEKFGQISLHSKFSCLEESFQNYGKLTFWFSDSEGNDRVIS